MRSPAAFRPRAAAKGTARKGSRLRILGGSLRGRRLAVPPGVRPTESRLREALFSIWSERVVGSRFLDLFAGSGAVGLEAISRGAVRAVFADGDPRVLRTLGENLAELAPERSRLWRRRLPGGGSPPPDGEAFDLIFADPPYRFSGYEVLLRRVSYWLEVDGELAIEHASRVSVADPCGAWRCAGRRCYGDSCLSFFRLARAARDRRG